MADEENPDEENPGAEGEAGPSNPFGRPIGASVTDDNEPIATMGQVKSIIRRKLRKQAPHEENFLNIYPMMDMMVILLVFLVAQFANSTASAIQESPELQIPYSTSAQEVQEAITVQVSRTEILFQGHRVVGLLSNGSVPPDAKRGGGTSFEIIPLKELASEVVNARRDFFASAGREFPAEVQIIADQRTPYRTITEVVFTLGTAGLKNIRFVVDRRP